MWGPATDVYYCMEVSPFNVDVYASFTNFVDEAEVQILDNYGVACHLLSWNDSRCDSI